MAKINAYLAFEGNCREAMTFYQECLGGTLNFMTVAETPMAGQMPSELQSTIMHATLIKGDLLLMASDMMGDKGLVSGNKIMLSLDCDSEEETRTTYDRLAAGGRANHPLEDAFWGALFGDLTDKFGNIWMLSFDRNVKK